jgi:hypothetical protein
MGFSNKLIKAKSNNMNFKSIKYWFTLFSGILLMVGLSVVLYASAYMNKGHPPASGIIALIVVMAITPFSILSIIVSVFGGVDYSGHNLKIYFLFLGLNIFYVFCISQIWFYKAILGRTI